MEGWTNRKSSRLVGSGGCVCAAVARAIWLRDHGEGLSLGAVGGNVYSVEGCWTGRPRC